MSRIIFFLSTSLICLQILGQGDGMNDRLISEYAKNIEVARHTITFTPGFETTGEPDFLAYIDPDLPFNGGDPVTDGEFNLNYIRVFEPIRNNLTDIAPIHNQVDYSNDWMETITYYDGLGREIQEIEVKASGYCNDIITPIIYDQMDRQSVEYLPYVIAQDGPQGPGGYRSLPEDEIRNYYNSFFGDIDGEYPFSEKRYDGSPINRIESKSNPGYDWRLNSGHEKEYIYGSNNFDDEVYRFSISVANELVKEGCYSHGTLFKTIYLDEDKHMAIEYTDKQGRTLQKTLNNGNQSLITQYVYDDIGLLRYVITPKAYTFLPSGGTTQINTISDDWVDQLCYYYQYDKRNRLVMKKIPGSAPTYLIYNKRNLLILSQDGELCLDNAWQFTKYDRLNRPVISGIYYHGSAISQTDMQEEVNSSSYDLYEIFTTGVGYSNNAFPELTSSDKLLTLTYYDSYDALQLELSPTDYDFIANDLPFYFLTSGTNNTMIKGLPTITKSRVLLHDGLTVADDWLLSVTYYDAYYHPIQTISDNHLGGKTILSSQINFTGEVEQTKETIDIGSETNTIDQQFSYDHAGRLVELNHRINEQEWVTLNHQKYNELSQLTRKKLQVERSGALQQIDYRYNIRGWLTQINDISHPDDDLFTMRLDYNNSENSPLFNGNIGSMHWQSKEFLSLKQYDFHYDGANRLVSSTYADGDKYSTSYQYDKNGNIINLIRSGELGGSGGYNLIDNLTYGYTGNQLKYVNDQTDYDHQENGFTDNGSYLTTNEYFYDQNGNMVKDLNKQIDHIAYNYLNLPDRIDIASSAFNSIHYLYTATGSKIEKLYTSNGAKSPPVHYIGPMVFNDSETDFILTPEGRAVRNDKGDFEYEYMLRDHLGNTRVTVDRSGNVLQDNSYYPFGMSMGESMTYQNSQASDNKYLYNGKELQDELGLNLYDYGARFYDPALGRWFMPDAYAESYENLSPYAYVGNDPINHLDPDGNFRTKFGAWWYKLWHGGDGILQDNGGEYFVYTDNTTVDDGALTVTSKRVFDWHGRNEGRNLEFEEGRDTYITQWNFQHDMEKMGIEVYYTNNINEARMGMLQIPAMVLMPNILKSSTGLVNLAEQGGRIKANSLKELKRLITQLSKPGSELTKKELKQLTKLVERYGGKIRKDLDPVKGRIKKPHVQVEGFGTSVKSRHIWLKKGVN